MGGVDKVIDDSFRQAGPCQSSRSREKSTAVCDSDSAVLSLFTLSLELSHRQHVISIYFVLCDLEREQLVYLQCDFSYFRVFINCIPNVIFAKPFLSCIVQVLGRVKPE